MNVGAKASLSPRTLAALRASSRNFRPVQPVGAFSRHQWAVRKMPMYWGIEPHLAATT